MADTIKATPQNRIVGQLAEFLRKARDTGDLVNLPVLGGVGSMLMGQTPEELTQWSYGNGPLAVPEMTRVPQFKKGRAESFSDLVMAAPGLAPVGKAVDRGLLAADPLVQKYGRQVEQALAPLVQAGYQRGGLTREMLDAMGSGTRSQIFIGPEAKTWRKTEAFKAAQMEKAKASPEEIWKATGTFRGPDGFWRQEIDDSASKFVNAAGIAAKAQALRDERAALKETLRPDRSGQGDLFPKQLTEARRPIRAREAELNKELNVETYGPTMSPEYRGNFAPYAYEHGPLYEAYPQLRRDVVTQGGRSGSDGVYGTYDKGRMEITRAGLLNDPRSTATHEFQHAVQDIEGFSPGGNTDYARRLGQEAMARIESHNDLMRIAAQHLDDPVMRKQYDEAMAARQALLPSALGAVDPYQAYRNLLGETEARAVQSRLPLSALQRRERFPLLDYETPRSQMIIPQNESLFKNSLLD
jgi:hypothetical protein